ncbi:hypothetical protein HDU97_004798 [Phlyctochytrium planicorne]|nr:hypothetical protein HDU97_004798 [Phlyctochytrium planicorne]
MDSVSLQIINFVARTCPNLLCILAYSPDKNFQTRVLSEMLESSAVMTVELRTLHQGDIENAIAIAFAGKISNVHSTVLEAIQYRVIGGSASFLFALQLSLLMEQNQKFIFSDGTGSFKDKDALSLLPENLKESSIALFHLLKSRDFQHLLKCASVVGKTFSLEEVASIWEDPTADVDEAIRQTVNHIDKNLVRKLRHLITIHDIFGYLEVATSPLFGQDKSNPLQCLYSFRNASTREAIYSLNNQETIRSRHAKLITFYESVITDATETVFLPLICFHHAKANVSNRTSVLKRIQYLEMIGLYMISSTQSYVEARQVYTEILDIIRPIGMEDHFDANLLAEWQIRLAFSYGHGIEGEIDTKRSMQHAKEALFLLKVNWPNSDSAWLSLLLKETALLNLNLLTYYLFRLKRLGHNVQPLLSLISNHLFRTHARLRDQISFDLYALNVALKLGSQVKNARGKLFASLSLKYWFMGGWNQLSTMLLKSAVKHINSRNEDKLDSIVYANVALHLNARGNWVLAQQYARRGMEHCFRKGDTKTWLLCASQLAFILIYNGNLADAAEIEKRCCIEAELCGLQQGVVWAKAILAIIQILTGQYSAFLSEIDIFKKGYSSASFQQKAVIDGIHAFSCIIHRRYGESIETVEKLVELLPKMHYTNVQSMHGLFLAAFLIVIIMEEHLEILSLDDKRKGSKVSLNSLTMPKPPTNLQPGRKVSRMRRVSAAPPENMDESHLRKRMKSFAVRSLVALKPFRKHSFSAIISSAFKFIIMSLDGSPKSAGMFLGNAHQSICKQYPLALALPKAYMVFKAWVYSGRGDSFRQEALDAKALLEGAGVKGLGRYFLNM